MDSEKFPIPGYGKYELEVFADGSYQVISHHKEPAGKPLSPGRVKADAGHEPCYNLYEGGSGTLLTAAQIRGKVERVKLKRMREEMNYGTRNSVAGIVATGDYIVGSIRKSDGAFSTSASPAKHLSLMSAKQEAARLAAIDKSKKYVVLKAEAIASVEEVSWS